MKRFFSRRQEQADKISRRREIGLLLRKWQPPPKAANLGLVGVDAGRDRVAVIRPDRGRATGKRREHDHGAEDGKKNGSHSLILVFF
jgi:hypothetical protein